MTFEAAVQFVLTQEGLYSNDPDDPGGETQFGISHRSYPGLQIKDLTKERALAIYQKDYWLRCRCPELPDGLDLLVFDAAVNQGAHASIVMLQQSLKVTEDGWVGPVTLKAASKANGILAEFLARRMLAYAMNPRVAQYGLGWFRRIAACASEVILKGKP